MFLPTPMALQVANKKSYKRSSLSTLVYLYSWVLGTEEFVVKLCSFQCNADYVSEQCCSVLLSHRMSQLSYSLLGKIQNIKIELFQAGGSGQLKTNAS